MDAELLVCVLIGVLITLAVLFHSYLLRHEVKKLWLLFSSQWKLTRLKVEDSVSLSVGSQHASTSRRRVTIKLKISEENNYPGPRITLAYPCQRCVPVLCYTSIIAAAVVGGCPRELGVTYTRLLVLARFSIVHARMEREANFAWVTCVAVSKCDCDYWCWPSRFNEYRTSTTPRWVQN